MFALALGAGLSWFGSARWRATVATLAAFGASALGITGAVMALAGGAAHAFSVPWSLPGGALHLGLDPLSAWFLIPTYALGAILALAGFGLERETKATDWPAFLAMIGAVVLVLLARDGGSFLLGWEAMAVSSFALVTSRHATGEGVREAGVRYLAAAHWGSAFLLVFFLFLGAPGRVWEPVTTGAGALFLLALLGFGTKAGLFPLHRWGPDAYASAPPHAAAFLSGVMSKIGIYGLFRAVSLLGTPAAWWGWTLVGVGLVSAVFGIAAAGGQRDLRRTLAYSSVENLGLITAALGVGVLGQAMGWTATAVLGYAAALLHVWHHGLMKALLLLAAGAVERATGTGAYPSLGGLARRMPFTSAVTLVGVLSIVGLPPFNGFVGEFLLYLAGMRDSDAPLGALLAALLFVGLALVGGMAVTVFSGAFSTIFLGTPRSSAVTEAVEVPLPARAAMGGLVAGILATAAGGWALLPWTAQIIRAFIPHPAASLSAAVYPLQVVAAASAVLVILAALLAVGRNRLLRGRPVGEGPTWGCGYLAATPRIQYTQASFVAPLLSLFAPWWGVRAALRAPTGVLSAPASLNLTISDAAHLWGYRPACRLLYGAARLLRPFQSGRAQVYVLYIAVTVVVLLITALGR